jgi:hypothetical protein
MNAVAPSASYFSVHSMSRAYPPRSVRFRHPAEDGRAEKRLRDCCVKPPTVFDLRLRELQTMNLVELGATENQHVFDIERGCVDLPPMWPGDRVRSSTSSRR